MKKYASTVAILMMSVFVGNHSERSQANDSVAEAKAKETVTDETQHDFKTLDERFSYAYGVELAEKFKAEGIELNIAIMAAAMQDVFRGAEMLMSAEEVAATTQHYEKLHYEKKEAERAVAGEKNKREGEAFLAENAKRDDVVVTESGLQYKVLTAGSGGYKPKEFDEVTVHYRGTFVDGTEFDSTYSRNKPHTAIVKQLIDGWTEALQLMSKGAVWELYIPADLAYGEQGSGQWVGPNATLIFKVELLDIEKEKQQ